VLKKLREMIDRLRGRKPEVVYKAFTYNRRTRTYTDWHGWSYQQGDTVSGKGNRNVYKDAEGAVYFWEDTDNGSAFNYGIDVNSFSTTSETLTRIEDPRRKAQVLENLLDYYKWAGSPVDVLLPYDGKKYWVRVVSGGQWVGPPDAIFRATGCEPPGRIGGE